MAALDCSGMARCCACLTGGKARRTSDELDAKAMFEMKVLEKRKDEHDDWRCYWDRFGVMRRERAPMRRDGKDFKHKPLRELAVMQAKTRDFFDPGDEVFLLHLEWLNQWLRFAVHGASTPGPITNSVLVTSKKKVKKKAKYNLHWRPVSKEIWDFLLTGGTGGGGYGGGPSIKFTYEGDAPLVGKSDIADYMTKTKFFKLAEVDFVIPETIEDDEYDRDAYQPSASFLVRDSRLFPPREGDNAPPPYENPLADAEQERRSGGGSEVGAASGLINPLHSGAGDGAGHDGGPTSPMHGMQPTEGILLSMDDSDGPGAAPPPSDDEGTLSDSEVDDDDDDDEGFTSVAAGGNDAALLAANDSDEDDEFVQAGPVHAPQRPTPGNPRANEFDLLGPSSPLHAPQRQPPPQAQGAPSTLDDVDDADLLDFDDDEMDDFRDASAPVVSQEIAEHELDDI